MRLQVTIAALVREVSELKLNADTRADSLVRVGVLEEENAHLWTLLTDFRLALER
jgi:hypothetical protein